MQRALSRSPKPLRLCHSYSSSMHASNSHAGFGLCTQEGMETDSGWSDWLVNEWPQYRSANGICLLFSSWADSTFLCWAVIFGVSALIRLS